MPDPIDGQPGAQPASQPPEGGPKANPEGGAAAAPAAEPAPTPEEIARWRSLESKFKEQNVDPDHLLPEFTRTRQYAKALEDEASQWRSLHQQQVAAQQRAANPADAIQQKIDEAASVGDTATALRLQRQLLMEDARAVAADVYGKASQAEKVQRMDESLRERSARFGINPAEIPGLAQKLQGNPDAVALALAYQRDPAKVEEYLLADRKRREKEADERTRFRSIMDGPGRNPGLGAKADADMANEPLHIPESMWFGKPSSYWKRTLGERFGKVVLTRHDGTPIGTP